ncbi:zinc finger protein 891 [Bicyclus anynana]|uniref:Zinc finger protein 891 n=1 Tax=Bicyclus anynana TaxID=110368 RepID=A0A6J1N931_BICAN|nr:zinc finger protein 891 [Bicyclus anynana]
MEGINVLLGSIINKNVCFLCFKESMNLQNVYDRLEIRSQRFNENLTLNDMILNLLPSFELTFTKSCVDCADLIIRMYIKIHRNNVMKKIINNIVDTIDKEISKNNLSLLQNHGKIDININFHKIMKHSVKISQNYNLCNTVDEIYDDNIANKSEEKSQENQCLICFKLLDNIKDYKIHVKGHKRKRKTVDYHCNYCNYKSPSKQSLQGHINKKHLKIKPHVCNICYKHYYHKKNLIEHEKIHSQIRNEICEVCGDSFIHKKNLLEHLKLHSGEKPYQCEVCDRRFITSGRRLEHIKRCHSEKNECCLLCDKKFSLIKELTRHIKTVHS